MPSPRRVLIAKIGLDGHDRGAKIIAAALRDAGIEVIYTGLHQTPEMIAQTAVQEDVDLIGVSILSGAHMTLLPKLLKLLAENQARDIPVIAGGIIPPQDAEALEKQGIARIFTPGATLSDVIAAVREIVSMKPCPAAPSEPQPGNG